MALGALEAGAEFLVSPCLVPEVIASAHELGVAVLPGAMTPTEVFSAWSLGGDIVKVFPASHAGGASYLKALKGPFPQIDLSRQAASTWTRLPGSSKRVRWRWALEASWC